MLTAIRQWVIRTMMKAKGETGIVQTMPKKDIVELNTQITAQRLMQNGINPESLKNADQVENAIIAIENRPKVQQGITSTKSADVFDLKGKKIKDTKNIMGGEELPPGDPDLPPPGSRGGPDDIAAPVQSAEETIKNMIEAENKKGIANIQKRILEEDREIENLYGSAGFGKDQKVDAEFLAEYLAENAGKVYDDLPTKERLDFYNRAFNALTRYKRTKGTSVIDEPKKLDPRTKEKIDDIKEIEDPEDMADGGRIGFKKGMDRRTFMKMVGGLTALPILGKFFKGAEVAAPVVEKAVDVASGAPPYFFDLVNKIKIFGKQRQTPSYKERVNEYTYQGKDGIEYELVEDLDTGDIKITKDKIGGANYGDESYDVIEDRTEMVYKKGQADETTKGTPADEYDEYKVEFDQDGTAADATEIDEVSKMEIIKEVSGDAPAIKKADGGIAMMVGE